MVRPIVLACHFLRRNVRAFLAESGNFWLYAVTTVLSRAPLVIFLSIIFDQIPSIRGWTFYELLFIYGFFTVVTGLFYLIFAWTLWFPEVYVVGHRLDLALTYPLPPYFVVLFEELGKSIMETVEVFVGLAMMLAALPKLSVTVTVLSLVQWVTSVIAAVSILGGVFTILCSFSFWHAGRASLTGPFMVLIELAQYPADIYARWLRVGLTFVLPILFAGFFPAGALLRPAMARYYPLTLVWGLVALAAGYGIWNLGLRRYDGSGN